MRMSDSTQLASRAGDRYLLLADISGYTAFMARVESDHGADFSAGIPAGFAIVGKLLDGVIEGVQPDFEVIKLEGDATVSELAGFCSASLLVNRTSGLAVSSVSYDSMSAMERSRERANEIRTTATNEASAEVLDISEFELALAHLHVPELA